MHKESMKKTSTSTLIPGHRDIHKETLKISIGTLIPDLDIQITIRNHRTSLEEMVVTDTTATIQATVTTSSLVMVTEISQDTTNRTTTTKEMLEVGTSKIERRRKDTTNRTPTTKEMIEGRTSKIVVIVEVKYTKKSSLFLDQQLGEMMKEIKKTIAIV